MFRVLAHFVAALRIAQQFDPGYTRVFGTLHLDGRIGGNEARGNLRKILHGRPEYRDFTERRGFENIVPAGGHERTSNEGAVSQAVERREFPDGIEKNHGNIAGYRTTVAGSRFLRVAG